jgi:hypothetical protein
MRSRVVAARSRSLPARACGSERARIGPVELAIVLRVTLGDVDHPHALHARRLHQLDRALEHSRLVIDRFEAGVPGAFRVDEIRLEIDQDDRGFLGFKRFGRGRLIGLSDGASR